MPHNQPYTSEEIQTVRDRYGRDGASQLAHLLQRSPDGIKALAQRLGLNSKKRRRRGPSWTQAKDAQLRKHARSGLTPPEIASRMGVAPSTVLSHARALDLALTRSNQDTRGKQTPWAAWELAIIDTYYESEGPSGCSARLPGRTVGAIRHKRCTRMKAQRPQSTRQRATRPATAVTPPLTKRRFFTSS